MVVFANFPRPWKADSDEIRALQSGHWAPTKVDWAAIAARVSARRPFEVRSFGQLITAITKNNFRIARLDFFSHGTRKGLLGMSGTVPAGGGDLYVGTADATGSPVSQTAINADVVHTLEALLDKGLIKGVNRKQLNDAFAPGAKVWLYSCNTGIDLELLQALANLLGVEVHGFQQKILFAPDHDGKKLINRARIGLGTTPVTPVEAVKSPSDLHRLDKDATLRVPKQRRKGQIRQPIQTRRQD